jgi:hypothetical protein
MTMRTMNRNPEKTLENLRNKRIKALGIYNRNQEIADLMEMPGWKRVQELVLAKLKDIDADLVGYELLTESQLKTLHAKRETIQFFASIADDFKAGLSRDLEILQSIDNEIQEHERLLTART